MRIPITYRELWMANKRSNEKTTKTPGPESEQLKSMGNWKALIREALEKKKPAGGWPGHTTKPKIK